MVHAVVAVGLVLLADAGCRPAASSSETSGWVGAISSEGTDTTVVNESGSVWAGEGRLIEQVSIGVAEGADTYMFGRLAAITMSADRIYVADEQARQVRVYDMQGQHLFDVGRRGAGPGEYERPQLLAVAGERLFVYDSGRERVNVFVGDRAVADWNVPDLRCCGWPIFPAADGNIVAPIQEWTPDGPASRRYGVQLLASTGAVGSVTWVPPLEVVQTTYPVGSYDQPTPYSPWLVWAPLPEGGLVVGGSDHYRFWLHRGDGSVLTVERSWQPVPLPEGHREWARRLAVVGTREHDRPDWTWNGAEMPRHKPAFRNLVPALSGEIWVLRPGASVRHEPCAEDPLEVGYVAARSEPCWTDETFADVFGTDGRFLGRVDLPSPALAGGLNLVVRDDRVLAAFEDEAGVVQVKLYRLEIPERASGTR